MAPEHVDVTVSIADAPEVVRTLENARVALEELKSALGQAYDDHHDWSTRPCGTCSQASKLLGRPVGCDRYRARREELDARRA